MTTPPEGPLRGKPSRLHIAAVAVWVGESAFSLVVALVVTGMHWPIGLGAFTALLLTILIRFLRFRWRLEPDAVVIEEGMLIRKRRVIRRERVQTVDLERRILHRILGVVEVRIEAMGAGGTEGTLAAVTPRLATALREELLEGRQAHQGTSERLPEHGVPEPSQVPEAARETVLARATPGDLVLAGISGGRVGVAAALIGFLFQTIPETWWADSVGRILQQAPDPSSVIGIRVLAVLVVFALLGGFFLSVVATVFVHWDFTLTVRDRILGVRRGLLTEHSDTVSLRRIQAVRIEENPVRRLLRRASLRAVVAGRAGGSGGEGTDLLLPIGPRDQVYDLARGIMGMAGTGAFPLRRMPSRARRRRMARAVMASLAVGAGAALLLPALLEVRATVAGSLGAAMTLIPFLLLAELAYRNLGWAELGDHVVVREGVMNRRTTLLPVGRLQALEITQTPFQRLARLGTLHLRVARPLMGATPRALDLDRKEAGDWQEALAGQVVARTTETGALRGPRFGRS
ncbi:MAG: PH domain-containing protein [Gemmatimonadota bacterium]